MVREMAGVGRGGDVGGGEGGVVVEDQGEAKRGETGTNLEQILVW